MTTELSTERLRLVALNVRQLSQILNNRTDLENELGVPILSDVIDVNVTRAVNMKLDKMANADERLHSWYTYWLIIVKEIPIGAGLIGFKSFPDGAGTTEVGYGIGASFRNQGYMTEALQALCRWAFNDCQCHKLTAQGVSNPASERVLLKSGWQKVNRTKNSSVWEIRKLNTQATCR